MRIQITVEHGTLSNEELKKLVQCIRDIEQNNPIRTIYILIDAPEKTRKEIEELFDSIKPGLPYKVVIPIKRDGG